MDMIFLIDFELVRIRYLNLSLRLIVIVFKRCLTDCIYNILFGHKRWHAAHVNQNVIVQTQTHQLLLMGTDQSFNLHRRQ